MTKIAWPRIRGPNPVRYVALQRIKQKSNRGHSIGDPDHFQSPLHSRNFLQQSTCALVTCTPSSLELVWMGERGQKTSCGIELCRRSQHMQHTKPTQLPHSMAMGWPGEKDETHCTKPAHHHAKLRINCSFFGSCLQSVFPHSSRIEFPSTCSTWRKYDVGTVRG